MIKSDDYDIREAFKAIEDELLDSMMRNMKRHRAEEREEGFEWSQWQVAQLKGLELYKRKNAERFQKKYDSINAKMRKVILSAKAEGGMAAEVKILDAIMKGAELNRVSDKLAGEFFRTNERKMDALLNAVTGDMERAERAILRMHDDKVRRAIFNAQVYANSGAGTYEKAVDMAVKDYALAGLNCILYRDGRRVNVKDYADMALRTASKRAYLMGEGEKRQEWGVHTVIMNKRGNACPKCLPFVGKVLIDDVWSGGKQLDGPYMLMSYAMSQGLYHPNCKDSHTTYFEGISTPGAAYTKEELAKIEKDYRQEQRQQYAERQTEKFDRLAKHSLEGDDKRNYQRRANSWKQVAITGNNLSDNIVEKTAEKSIIKLSGEEQYALNQYFSFESYGINAKLRNGYTLSETEKSMVYSLDMALDKMPEYQGTVYRSLSDFGIENVDEFVKSYVPGQVKTFSSFISSSEEIYDAGFPIQYIIKSKHGRDIRQYNYGEKEILFKRNSKFLVIKVEDNIIYLEEI